MTGNGILYHDESGDAVSDQGGLEHVALAFNSDHMVHPKNSILYQNIIKINNVNLENARLNNVKHNNVRFLQQKQEIVCRQINNKSRFRPGLSA